MNGEHQKKDLTALAMVENAYKAALHCVEAEGYSWGLVNRLGHEVNGRIATDLILYEEPSVEYFSRWYLCSCAKLELPLLKGRKKTEAEIEIAKVTRLLRRKPFVRNAAGDPVSKVRRSRSISEMADSLVAFTLAHVTDRDEKLTRSGRRLLSVLDRAESISRKRSRSSSSR